jgi:hypothetical protein
MAGVGVALLWASTLAPNSSSSEVIADITFLTCPLPFSNAFLPIMLIISALSMPMMRKMVCTKSTSAADGGFWLLSIALLSWLSPLSEDLLTVLVMAADHTLILLYKWVCGPYQCEVPGR